ncbi:alpha/beta fold hydrolase [Chondromyces apiculatus]|uniref:Alpha/beta hydrolase fold protein n=1 Tax=Chondromyces apiculatus DSM 436 TaxID=1192034 RepID=A0A017T367_9BACT|nr:alpha/beta hydrolase [Chondromyces apiculatus]EYF03437.1 Alpha/beta hydrolase fold protein [Chondromyces apiculatus DSM 436]
MRATSDHHDVNGIRLFVRRLRDDTAPPTGLTVLLLHGFLDAGATWDRIATPLAAAGHHVILPDLRGFGESGWIGAGGYYHFPDYVADVAALVDLLAPERLCIVAHSMGGAIAAYYTGTFPQRVHRLALLEGIGPTHNDPELAVPRMERWLRDLQRCDRTPRPMASLDEAIKRLTAFHPRIPRDVLEVRATQLTRRDDTGTYRWTWDPLHRTTAPTPFSGLAFSAFLRNITCPTLLVTGGPSGWRPAEETERFACLQTSEHVDLPDAGHMMHWSQPEALAAALITFLARVP